ncbi:MAG: glycosyltransferase 87 family protein [Kiritimatiellales bacterium]|nr:glycosyltransferase 87 family protein [Kiritimatiellales bacterium]
MSIRRLTSPWLFIALMTAGLFASLLGATNSLDRDFYFYQEFIQKLADFQFDFSVPGFHGSNLFAVPWYWITSSEIAAIEIQLLFALLLPACAYLAGKELFNSKWHGLMLAAIVTMTPFVSVISKIGYTSSGLFVLMLLTIYGACKGKWWAGVTFGLAMLTKPFAIALLPLLWVKRPKNGSIISRHRIIILGLIIPAMYIAIQYLQVGHIIVGVHPELSESTVWQGPTKILMNLAYALQILFSVHNYHYPNPAGTGHENLLHTTPLLIFLALFAFMKPSQFIVTLWEQNPRLQAIPLG